MSLEQALIAATAAITQLTTVLLSTNATGSVAAAPAEKAPRKSKSDAQVVTPVADTQVTAVPVAISVAAPVLDSAAVGARYFHIPAHNTVYMQLAGMADCTLPGALLVSEAEYEIAKAEIAKKFPTASAAAIPAPVTSAPTATAQQVLAYTFEQVVEKLRAMHKIQGDTGVAKVLAHFGVSRVPELNGKAKNSDVVDFIASVEA